MDERELALVRRLIAIGLVLEPDLLRLQMAFQQATYRVFDVAEKVKEVGEQ